MPFKSIREIISVVKSIDTKLDEFRSVSVDRAEFSRLYKRVNQIYFTNRETNHVSLGEEVPVTLATIMTKVMNDNDLTKIITTTYVALTILLKYSKSSVQEKELTEAISILLLNREKFRMHFMNGYSSIFILSNVNIDALKRILTIFADIDNFDKFVIISNPNEINSIAKRYPTLFISSTELSMFTIAGKEYSITEHPSFILAALMYLVSEQDDLKSLVFLP